MSAAGTPKRPAVALPRIQSARFLFGAGRVDQVSRLPYPTVAFVGRSNVGKSSLLNRLVGQRKLARVSKSPGRTQEINVFLLNERLALADLPGYGFARVPRPVQDQWKGLVEGFLSSESDIRLVAVLVDARRGLQAADTQLLDYLKAVRRNAALIATKIDKLTYSQRKQSDAQLRRDANGLPTLACSAVTGEGLAELWIMLETACN